GANRTNDSARLRLTILVRGLLGNTEQVRVVPGCTRRGISGRVLRWRIPGRVLRILRGVFRRHVAEAGRRRVGNGARSGGIGHRPIMAPRCPSRSAMMRAPMAPPNAVSAVFLDAGGVLVLPDRNLVAAAY